MLLVSNAYDLAKPLVQFFVKNDILVSSFINCEKPNSQLVRINGLTFSKSEKVNLILTAHTIWLNYLFSF